MANIITRYEILKLLDNGCIHRSGELCSSCLSDVRAWVLKTLQDLKYFSSGV